jgi:hypothetical protein
MLAIVAACSSPATADPNVAQWERLLPPDPNTAPARLGHTAIFDPVRNRMIVYGGDQASPDLWEMTLGADVHWEPLTVTGPSPPAHSRHTAIYDPIRDRMIVFGGDGTSDVWALSLAEPMAWTRLDATGATPMPRTGHTAIYDSAHDRMIVFGGYAAFAPGSNYETNDVWALSLSDPPAWTPVTSNDPTQPAARQRHAAVYDPVRDRMIIFGGEQQFLTFFDDTWALPLSGPSWWMQLPATGAPHWRYGHSAVYDALRDRMVVYGGTTDQGFGGSFAEAWALPLSVPPAWQLLDVSPAAGARWGHSAVLDPRADRMLVYSGVGTYYMTDCWSLSLKDPQGWARLTPSSPPTQPSEQYLSSADYDPIQRRMIVFGGSSADIGPTDELWTLSLESIPRWIRTPVPGGPTPSWVGYEAVIDRRRNQLVVVAQRSEGIETLDEVWTLSLSPNMEWKRISLTGPLPSGRQHYHIAYDDAYDEVVIWGGIAWANLVTGPAQPEQVMKPRQVSMNDCWTLALDGAPQWRQLASSSFPVAAANSYFDPKRHRLVGFGDANSRWELPLAADGVWSPLASIGPAPPTGNAVYDPLRDRLVGFDAYLQIPWSMALDSDAPWEPVPTSASPPSSRYGAAIAYDTDHDRALVFAGAVGGAFMNDAWALSFDTVTATELSLVRADATSDRVSLSWYGSSVSGQTASLYRRTEQEDWSKRADLVAIDGTFTAEDRDIRPGQRYAYRLQIGSYTSPTTWIDVPNAPRFEILGVSPNPSHGALRVSYSLPTRGAVAFELFDLQGRCVMRREAENVDAGSHVTPWGANHSLTPAVYMLRVTQGSNRRTARVVVTE